MLLLTPILYGIAMIIHFNSNENISLDSFLRPAKTIGLKTETETQGIDFVML
jgi:hypothetical protein